MPVALAAESTPLPPLPSTLTKVTDVRASQLLFVFSAGKATYVRLADLSNPSVEGAGAEEGGGESNPGEVGEVIAAPRHGKLRHVEDDGVHAAIAAVAPRDVPAAYASWQGHKVKVDNACDARVVSFAVVARVTGDPSYAGAEAWTAANVLDAGRAVLAAKLDGCTGVFARDAALPPIVVPTRLHDAALERTARAALLASAAARDAQREWDEQSSATGAPAGPWHAGDAITSEVIRYPGTGATFVSVHGHVTGGCGEPHANVWGLFRVTDGKLEPIQLRSLGDVESIDQLIDVDGDGDLEILGKPWLGTDEVLTDAKGELLDHLRVPFHGCAC